ncbi:ficolin-2-like [Anopheles stephensi]|uniref:ficolin-2-like n=1 Tax=Anopheles stephensi TaxID=30069 RepID=UPI001658729F|nr:ficolin-2-like [Anopheles stephensi]XP_035918238.1 ficolin-2-like [Anopheles stephensi]
MSRKLCLLTFLLLCSLVAPQCDSTAPLNTSSSGFAFEMILVKLQLLEHQFIVHNMETEEKITVLSAKIENLIKNVESLAWTAQQTEETANQLKLNGKYIAKNLTAIQSDLTSVLTEQKLLRAKNQWKDQYLSQRCGNSTILTLNGGSLGGIDHSYKSCNKIPFLVSGVYTIQPEKPFKKAITVLCDQEYESGGWTVIQHRFDGSLNFYREWQEYKDGFGNLDGEFWLGLDRIHQLTNAEPHELVVLLEDFEGNKTHAKYDQFQIGNEHEKYALNVLDGYSGTAGDSLGGAKAMKFSTFDSDNDSHTTNCASVYHGAWWYAGCHQSNLNGKYLRGHTEEYATGMVWKSFGGYHYSLKSSKMMIRPKSN